MSARYNLEVEIQHRVNAFYDILTDISGTDRLVLKASKLEALDLLRSENVAERVLALQKVVYEDPTMDTIPSGEEIAGIMDCLEEELAKFLARRAVEDELEQKIAAKMEEKNEEYLKEIKIQILKDHAGPENAQTLKRLAILEKMEQTGVGKNAMELLRPRAIEEIVGQEHSVAALVAKLASPFPQHILMYGPPGVGKTSAARLAMEVSKKLGTSSFAKDAPFKEVNGATLRWDPRDMSNPLLGSVHDPIYQGAKKDLAETGVPEPKLGLVSEAHGGILFIDEIGEMDPMLLNKLLKVLEDKRVFFESSYYDSQNEQVPEYIKKLFDEGVAADFILIGATTRDSSELNPALRSRCAEIYFDPLTPSHIQQIIIQAAEKLQVKLEQGIPELISDYTIEGRKANNILADAYGLCLYQGRDSVSEDKPLTVTKNHVFQVVRNSRLTPYVNLRASNSEEIGRILGLGVSGFIGSVLEIEAVAFPATGNNKGQIRFNETAGSMARDSVFNAAAVFRALTGEETSSYDVHVNVVGGGRIDGPSAGVAVFLSLYSAIKGIPLRQDVAVTGEISIQGKVKPVGGVYEKIFGAKQAGICRVLIPQENVKDVPSDLKGIEVVPIATVDEALTLICKQRQQGLA